MSKFTDWLRREVGTKISVVLSNFDLNGNLPINKLLVSLGVGSTTTLIDNTISVWKFKGTDFIAGQNEAFVVDVSIDDISMELPLDPIDGFPMLLKIKIDSMYNKTLIVNANALSIDTIDNQNDVLIVDYSTDLILVYDKTNKNWRV